MLNKANVSESITAVLVFLFLYTGLSKYADLSRFVYALHQSPLLGGYASFISIILPAVEIFLVVLLAWPVTRLLGLYMSAGLLSLFTVYLIYMVNFSPQLPCTCGGIINQLSWGQHIFLNLFLIVLTYLGIVVTRRQNLKGGIRSHVF